jgi:transposase
MEVIVGVDVARHTLDVHVLPIGTAFSVAQTVEGLDALIATITPFAIHAVALEVGSGFGVVAAACLGAAGLPVIGVDPVQLHAFAQTLGRKATVSHKAAVIARFVEVTKPQIPLLPSEDVQSLAGLVSNRRTLVHMIVIERQREHQMPSLAMRETAAHLTHVLQNELDDLDSRINSAVRAVAAWRDANDQPDRTPTIGKLVSQKKPTPEAETSLRA